MQSFTHTQFLLALAAYQESIWPAQPVAYALAIVAVIALFRSKEIFRRLTLAILALLWGWVAIAYHWLLFTEVTPAALVFGLLFAAQAGLFLFAAMSRGAPPNFRLRNEPASISGAALLAYALLVYPLLDFVLLAWPRVPSLGISPCPVTLFTLGFLLLAAPRFPARLCIVPIVWAVLEGVTAFLLGIVQDWPLLFAGMAALWFMIGNDNRTGGGGSNPGA